MFFTAMFPDRDRTLARSKPQQKKLAGLNIPLECTMLKNVVAWLTLAVLAISILLLPIAARSAPPSDEAQIRGILYRYAKAVHDRDIDGIMAMYDRSGVIAYDIVPPLQFSSYDSYKQDYESFLEQYRGPITITFRGMTIVTDGQIAFAYMLEHVVGLSKEGGEHNNWMRVTSCFRKMKGRWIDVHDHLSVPTDFVTGRSALNLQP